jgi:hypothetical protein
LPQGYEGELVVALPTAKTVFRPIVAAEQQLVVLAKFKVMIG